MIDRTREEAQISPTEDKSAEPTNKERRELFKKLGKYTAPVVIAILVSEKAYAQSGPEPRPVPPTPPTPPPPPPPA